MDEQRGSVRLRRALRAIAVAAGVGCGSFALLIWWLKSGAELPTTLPLLFGAVSVALFALAAAPNNWMQRGVLAFLASLVGLLIGEPFLSLVLGPGLTTIYQLDDVYLLELVPDSMRVFEHSEKNGGHKILVSVNSAGFRGEELQTPGGHARIVVYGDSFIEAEFSELPDTFSEQLEQRLQRKGWGGSVESVEVVNAGVVAYGPDQVALRMRDELPRLAPKLAIVAIYAGNDYGELVRNKLFTLTDDRKLQRNRVRFHDSLTKQFWLARWEPTTLKLLERAGRRVVDTLKWRYEHHLGDQSTVLGAASSEDAAMKFIEESLRKLRDEYDEHIVRGSDEVRWLLGDPYDADVALLPRSDSARYKRRVMSGVLSLIKDTADTHGVEVLVLVIPSPIDVCDKHDLGSVDTTKYPEYQRAELSRVVELQAIDHGMSVINLFEPFRSGGGCGLYLRGNDNHWNDAGQRVAAEIVSEYLVREPARVDQGGLTLE